VPRKPRFTLPGVPRHVIQRRNNRRAPCFLAGYDYRRYLEDLAATAGKSDCRVHAYVLMTNHVHLPGVVSTSHG
jgi:putative transposase